MMVAGSVKIMLFTNPLRRRYLNRSFRRRFRSRARRPRVVRRPVRQDRRRSQSWLVTHFVLAVVGAVFDAEGFDIVF